MIDAYEAVKRTEKAKFKILKRKKTETERVKESVLGYINKNIKKKTNEGGVSFSFWIDNYITNYYKVSLYKVNLEEIIDHIIRNYKLLNYKVETVFNGRDTLISINWRN